MENHFMKEQFKDYLLSKGYSEYTPSGNPSTVYDYIYRIEKICLEEGSSWEMLASDIDRFVKDYDVGGKNENIGQTSHRAVINALKAFKAFLENR